MGLPLTLRWSGLGNQRLWVALVLGPSTQGDRALQLGIQSPSPPWSGKKNTGFDHKHSAYEDHVYTAGWKG